MLEFTNNVAGSDSAMQVDQIAETFNEEQRQEHTGADPVAWTRPGIEEQYVNAFGKGASQCYNCQGYGHFGRECPSKGKGKGKGFEKGTDKGKGKGMSTCGPIRNNAKGKEKSKGPMFGTCWTCGGAHYAANCKGKGINQVGEPEVFDQWEPEEWGSLEIRTLSHIQERMLDPEPEGASKEGWTLVDFVKKRRRQGEVKKAKKEKAQELRIIRTIEPETVNSVTVIDLAVDSGASETMISEDMLPNIPIKQGDASRRGVQYEVANGVRIPNLGEKEVPGGIARKGPSGASPLRSAR